MDCTAFIDLGLSEKCQTVSKRQSQSLIRSWKSFNSQSSAITLNPSRLTAGPLMSKHALWQIYGYMGSTAKLSKKTFFSCTFILFRKDKQGEGDMFKDLCWCSDVMFNWLRFGFKRISTHSRKQCFFTVSCGDPTESFITFQYRLTSEKKYL